MFGSFQLRPLGTRLPQLRFRRRRERNGLAIRRYDRYLSGLNDGELGGSPAPAATGAGAGRLFGFRRRDAGIFADFRRRGTLRRFANRVSAQIGWAIALRRWFGSSNFSGLPLPAAPPAAAAPTARTAATLFAFAIGLLRVIRLFDDVARRGGLACDVGRDAFSWYSIWLMLCRGLHGFSATIELRIICKIRWRVRFTEGFPGVWLTDQLALLSIFATTPTPAPAPATTPTFGPSSFALS